MSNRKSVLNFENLISEAVVDAKERRNKLISTKELFLSLPDEELELIQGGQIIVGGRPTLGYRPPKDKLAILSHEIVQ